MLWSRAVSRAGGTGGNASVVRWPRPCRGAARSWTSGARTGRSWRMSSRGAGNAASTSTRGVSTSRRTSPDLVALARHRYPHWSGHVLVGDAAGWSPPRRWDVVRTELVYVDSGVRPALVRRLLREFVSPGGSLLVCRYGDRTETARPARRRTPRGAGLLGLLPRGRPHRHRRRRAGAHGRRGGAPPLTRGSSQATRPGSPRRNTGLGALPARDGTVGRRTDVLPHLGGSSLTPHGEGGTAGIR